MKDLWVDWRVIGRCHRFSTNLVSCSQVLIIVQSVCIAYLVWESRLETLIQLLPEAIYAARKDNGLRMEKGYQDNTNRSTILLDHLSSGQFSSSVFCNGVSTRERICRFENLCYHSVRNEFLFIHNFKSQFFGLPRSRNDPPFLDSSGVHNHNGKYFFYTDTTIDYVRHLASQASTFLSGDSIIMQRFNPENLMHVIHDDLLPLYHTRQMYFPSRGHDLVRIVLLDNREPGPFFDLYLMLSTSLIPKNQLQAFDLVCFESALVGLSKTLTWYQYGFDKPQGPEHKEPYPASELMYFRNYVLQKIVLAGPAALAADVEQPYAVFFARTRTRLVLNEAQAMLLITSTLRIPVYRVDLDADDLASIIRIVSEAAVLVGVHGAHMVTALFMLPSKSAVIELFPYGISPENYSPYRTLCNLLGIRYWAWENLLAENSFPHPERPPDLGGINHLSRAQQRKIVAERYVPKHICCDDPAWLYRAYQDTLVDLVSFSNILAEVDQHLESVHVSDDKNGLVNRANFSAISATVFYVPSIVENVRCEVVEADHRARDGDSTSLLKDSSIHRVLHVNVSWSSPWNMAFLSGNHLKYQVFYEELDERPENEDAKNSAGEILEASTEFAILSVSESTRKLHVWVRGVCCEKRVGPLSPLCVCAL